MSKGKFVFAQLVANLDDDKFRHIVDNHDGNRYVKNFSCWNQLLVLMFGQLSGRESLRDLIVAVEAHSGKAYRLGFGKSVTRSNLTKANQNRDCRIFEEYAFYMMELARNLNDTTIFNLGGTVYAFDSTTVELCLAVFCWAKFRKKKGGIKIHTLYDVEAQVPAFFHITTASVHDSQAMKEIPVETGSYYIFDRAYNFFAQLYLACAVACIAASFSLITWYNKMLNDSYGRLDMRAVVRTLIVLFLTCNFYSFVLVPFDGITHTVTKAVSASVDKDGSGLWGKVNEVYSSIEEKSQKETLVGQFDAEMAGASSSTSVEGMKYETSVVAESLAEMTVQDGKRPGFFKRLWAGAKGFVSAKLGTVMNNVGNIVSALLSVLVKLVQYILLAVSSIYLIILGLIGPFVFALSLIPGFENNISVWLARYIQISFWCPMAALIDYVNFKLKDAMVAAFWSASNVAQLGFPLHLIVLDVVTLICLTAVPQMASWVITGSGASDVNRGIASTAQKGAVILGKFK